MSEPQAPEGQELNKGHYHEIIDRGHLIIGVIDDYLIDHPGMTEEMNTLCKKAQDSLYRVTNLACGEEDLHDDKWLKQNGLVRVGEKDSGFNFVRYMSRHLRHASRLVMILNCNSIYSITKTARGK